MEKKFTVELTEKELHTLMLVLTVDAYLVAQDTYEPVPPEYKERDLEEDTTLHNKLADILGESHMETIEIYR